MLWVKGGKSSNSDAMLRLGSTSPFCISWVFDSGNPRVLAGKLATHFAEMERLHDDWVRFLQADVRFYTAIVEEVGNTPCSEYGRTFLPR